MRKERSRLWEYAYCLTMVSMRIRYDAVLTWWNLRMIWSRIPRHLCGGKKGFWHHGTRVFVYARLISRQIEISICNLARGVPDHPGNTARGCRPCNQSRLIGFWSSDSTMYSTAVSLVRPFRPELLGLTILRRISVGWHTRIRLTFSNYLGFNTRTPVTYRINHLLIGQFVISIAFRLVKLLCLRGFFFSLLCQLSLVGFTCIHHLSDLP